MKRYLMIGAGVLALSAGMVDVREARAESSCATWCTASPMKMVAIGVGATFGAFLVKLVVDDIRAGGLSRRVAAVEPGAGYSTTLDARLSNSPDLRAHVAAYEVAYRQAPGAVMVASAAR